MTAKKAFITGITGQDGSYLADLLLGKGYEVHALIRRSSTINTQRIDHLLPEGKPVERFNLHFGDLADANNLTKILEKIVPDEVYNLAAQSHVRISFDMPVYTADVVVLGALRLLEVIR